jgi:hypothetical protein
MNREINESKLMTKVYDGLISFSPSFGLSPTVCCGKYFITLEILPTAITLIKVYAIKII